MTLFQFLLACLNIGQVTALAWIAAWQQRAKAERREAREHANRLFEAVTRHRGVSRTESVEYDDWTERTSS